MHLPRLQVARQGSIGAGHAGQEVLGQAHGIAHLPAPVSIGFQQGELLAPDQVDDDLPDGIHEFRPIQGAVEPVARHVEVRQVGVLLLDGELLLGGLLVRIHLGGQPLAQGTQLTHLLVGPGLQLLHPLLEGHPLALQGGDQLPQAFIVLAEAALVLAGLFQHAPDVGFLVGFVGHRRLQGSAAVFGTGRGSGVRSR